MSLQCPIGPFGRSMPERTPASPTATLKVPPSASPRSAPMSSRPARANFETSSSGVTLTAVSYLGSGQVGWARGTELQPPQSMVISASESKTANETVRNHAHWPGHALLGNYGMMTSDQSPICDEHSKHHDDHWQPGRLCQMPTSGESESCDPDSSCQPTQQH